MKRFFQILILVFISFTLIPSVSAFADDDNLINAKPDRGKYVYDPSHLLNDSQLREIRDINFELSKGKHPQSLVVFIIPKVNDKKYYPFFTSSLFRDSTESAAGRLQDYTDSGDDREYRYKENINVIAYDMSTGKTSYYSPVSGNDNDEWTLSDYPKLWWTKGLFTRIGLHSHVRFLQANAITHYVKKQSQPMIHFNKTGHYFYGSVLSKWTVLVFFSYIYVFYNIIQAIRGKPIISDERERRAYAHQQLLYRQSNRYKFKKILLAVCVIMMLPFLLVSLANPNTWIIFGWGWLGPWGYWRYYGRYDWGFYDDI